MSDALARHGIHENLRFLIVEVSKQVERTHTYLGNPTTGLLNAILARDDYIDHLKNLIQRVCYEQIARREYDDDNMLDILRTAEIVAINLERIADFCENIVRQTSFIENESVLTHYNLVKYFNEVISGLSLTGDALFGLDTNLALRICRTEDNLDRLYRDDLYEIIENLRTGDEAQSLVTCMFIAHYLERMGDSLLNIGEAILSAKLGERIKIGQLRSLEESLSHLGFPSPLNSISLDHVADTRSGSRIDRVTNREKNGDDKMLIFKEGQRRKLVEERDGIARWNELIPGLAPEVYSFTESGDKGALLFEYLPGETLESLVLSGEEMLLDRALGCLAETLSCVWRETRRDKPVSALFVEQVGSRIDEVYALHPEFREHSSSIGTIDVISYDSLLDRARLLEDRLKAPFSVLIHGDFNIDNIIYSADQDQIRFVDLHRSEMLDYAQDVSVFLVSNYRLQVFDVPIRNRINTVMGVFLDFACNFAASAGDTTFQARLALGLARSFMTSARFVLDQAFARSMFLRSRYLLERLTAVDPDALEAFRFPREALID
jgi:phosphate uptake regulator